ncbi:hypothetical protein GEMRC1_005643 [Eukaryota sp. GEM-RC1]
MYEAAAVVVVSVLIPAGHPNQQNSLFVIQFIANVAHVTATVVATVILTVLTKGPPLFTMLETFSATKKMITSLNNWKEWRIQSGRIGMLPAPEDPSDLCTICQCPLNVPAFSSSMSPQRPTDNFGRQLSCSHSFHDLCLMRWFAQRRSCPICSAAIVLDAPEPPSPSSLSSSSLPPSRSTVRVFFNPNSKRLEVVPHAVRPAPEGYRYPEQQQQPVLQPPPPNHAQREVEIGNVMNLLLAEIRQLSERVRNLEEEQRQQR